MFADFDGDVEVAGAAAFAAGVAFAVEADLHSGFDAGGDADFDFAFAALLAAAAALAAGGRDYAAASAAGGAADDLGELAENAALGAADLAAALAGGAGVHRCAGFAAGAGTVAAMLQAVDFHFAGCAENGFLEGEGYLLLDVGAAAGLAGAAGGCVAEKGIEDIAEAAEYVEAVEGAAGSRPVGAGADAGLAEAVVLGAFFGVGQDLIGFVDFLEFILGAGVFVAVGMVFHSHAAEGAAYILVAGVAGNAQKGVVVVVGHQQSLKGRPKGGGMGGRICGYCSVGGAGAQ